MIKVLLTEPAIAPLASRIAAKLPEGVVVAAVSGFDDDEFRRLGADATVLVNARRRIDATTLAMAPSVRFVQLIGVGTDTIDRAAVADAGVTVAYNPGVNTTGVAEHVVMLMLTLVKRLPISEAQTRAGRFAPGEVIGAGIDDLAGATVGLVGMGRIARSVAERLIHFDAQIVYSSRRPVADVDERLRARQLSLAELLRVSKIVSLHVPLTAQTHHLVGAAELAAMPAGSYLVNAARGGLIDEAALHAAIVNGHLGGAALDVLERENDGHNPFADLPSVIVTPHVGGGSRNSMAGVVDRSAANIRRFLAGEPVADPIPDLP
ncbi:MAG TPA: NAD(P)-dependent oxidoreductase [Candidatus Limnocylindrales bacterium]|nr:NAD(P)-dependent oxidoreductase [Candidatus Limnocylindrales bacterium]